MGKPALAGGAPVLVGVAAVVLLAWPGDLVTGCWVVGAIGLAVLLADLVLAPRPASIAVERDFPKALSLGTSGELAWSVYNPHRRAVTVALSDQLAPSLRAGARRARARVGAGRSVRAAVVARPSRRGRFAVNEMVVRANGPLGLMARQAARQVPAELRVYPAFGGRREAELLVERARSLEVGVRSARARGGATDFEQLRDYTVDDDARRIDWAATARTDRAIARTYRAERNQRVICLLDNGRSMAAQVAGVARSEHAIDAVMMLTSVAAGVGDMPGLVAFDRRTRAVVGPRGGRQQLNRVTEALYDLAPVLAQSDYRGAFAEVLARFQRRAMLVLLTELDEAMVITLLPALPLISRSHVLLVGAVPDPAVLGWAGAPGPQVDGAYRSAAAVATLARRQELAGLLRARGAVVVDAPPGLLGPRLVDAYLDTKASGRL